MFLIYHRKRERERKKKQWNLFEKSLRPSQLLAAWLAPPHFVVETIGDVTEGILLMREEREKEIIFNEKQIALP